MKVMNVMNKATRHGLAAGLLVLVTTSVWADGRRLTAPQLQAYQQECAACHMAYPPGLLPASSWQRIMGGLDQHFGVNASLDDASVAEISRYLQTHSGRGGESSSAPPQDRITQSRWFVRHHRFTASDWAHPRVKRASNCMACHVGAQSGDFDEDRVRVPQGVGGRNFWHSDD